jgi:hypothetical protein
MSSDFLSDRAHENTVFLELEYGQVQGILAAVFRVAAGHSPVGEQEQRTLCDLFPQAREVARSIRPLAEAATTPLLDYLDRTGIAPPTSEHEPAADSVVLVELTVDECQRLAGAGTAAVNTWDLMLEPMPSWLVRLTPAYRWRLQAIEAVADWLSVCRAAGVQIEIY